MSTDPPHADGTNEPVSDGSGATAEPREMSADVSNEPLVGDVGSSPTLVGGSVETRARDEGLYERTRNKLFGSEPEQIGRYRIVGKLGEGGMGVVYAGHDAELDRRVAIKLLRSDLDLGAQGRDRMRREAQAMAKLSHPNVAHVYEVGEHDGRAFVVMEFIDGPTLRKWAESDPGWSRIVDMIVQASHGLASAHARGVIHRDFKPDNVLVGDDGRPRVVDFGLARPDGDPGLMSTLVRQGDAAAEGDALHSPLTMTGSLLGTPAYMAPEQFRGEPADAQTDQFSVCVSLYELLFGERPFAGASIKALAQATEAGPRLSSDRAPDVPRVLEEVLLRGLAPRRADRFPNMEALIDALQAAVREPEHKRRRRRLAWGGAAIAALGGALFFAATRTALVQPPADSGAPSHQHRAILEASRLPETLAEPLADDQLGVTIHRLDNGLTVYIGTRRERPRIAARLIVRTGTEDEPAGLSGLAPLLVDVLQQGSDRLGTLDHSRERTHLQRQFELFEQLSTTRDAAQRERLLRAIDEQWVATHDVVVPDETETLLRELGADRVRRSVEPRAVYFNANLPAARFTAWLRLMAEQIRRPAFRGVMAQARARMNLAPFFVQGNDPARDAMIAELYPQTPIAASIDDPMAASREVAFTQLKRFHGTWFVPNNVAIALIGDIDARAALAEIEQAFGDWDPAELPEHTDSSGTGPRERVEGTVVVDDPLARLWSIGWRVPPDRFDPAVVAVLTQVVEQSGFAVEQRFSLTAVRSRPSFARHIVFETLAADQAAIDSTSASEARGQGFERDVLAVIEAIARGDLPEREIVAAKLHFERVHHDVLADSDAALEQLAEAYVHGVEWAERVAFPKQIRDVTSDQVQQLARDLLAAGHVSIDSEVGQPKLPETAPLPTTALQASGRRSEFGRALAAEAVTEVQPEFLVEGRHYRVDTAPTQTVISAKVPGEVFHLRLEFPLTEDSPPLACLALTSAYFVSRDDSSLGRQFRQLGALIVEATCPVDVVRLELHGLDRNFEATLAWLAKFIEDAELSPFSVENSRRWVGGFAKQYSESRNILQWALGNHALGFTRRSLEDALQTEAIRSDRTTPGQVEATLRHFRTVAPTILYSGPRPESVAGEIAGTWTAAKHVEIPPLRAKALPHPRIFALQLGGPQPVYVTVAVPRPPLAVRDDLLVDVFNAYVDEALRSATRKNDAFLAFGGSYQKPWQSTDDGFVLFQGVAAHPGAIDEVVSEIRTLVTGPLDPELFEHAKQSVERSYRDDRVSPHDIPERVLEWLRRGHQIEPRLSGWGRLEGLTVDEFAAFVGNIAAAPFAVTFATDLSKLDMDELRTIAPVERVSKSALRM